MASVQKRSQELKGQLDELTRIRRSVAKFGTPDFASAWALESLKNHEAMLAEEVEAAKVAESPFEVKVRLNGDPVSKHTIVSKVFGQFLIELQDCLNAIAYATTARNNRRNLIQNNKLSLASMQHGSVEVGFKLNSVPEDEAALMHVRQTQVPLDILGRLLDNTVDVSDSLDLLANARLKQKYKALLNTIGTEGATIGIKTKRNPYSVGLNAQEARDRVQWLELLESENKEETITGELKLGDIDTGRFRIQVGVGLLDETYEISGRAETAKQLRGVTLGDLVTAVVQVTTTTHKDPRFEPKLSYLLKNIRKVPGLFDDESQEESAPVTGIDLSQMSSRKFNFRKKRDEPQGE